ncbi:MAG: hypothetical protein EA425_10245 [Puniceicoccaceae bacterium]|nr:MAG: hypothetical protein EA425_10245 [Puniceicoccaceae bacterium]
MAGIGETVTLQGSGFSPVTQAWFLDMLWGAYEVVITVVSDELIELTVPELDFFSFHPQNALIVLKGPAGATVTLAQSTTIITEEGLDEILSQRDYYVQQGAVLDASRSRLRVYLESGASASLTGQNPTVFAETGSSLSVTNPGFGSRFFLAPGLTPPVSPFATIIESVPAIQPSWLPTLLWVTPQLTVSIDPPPEAILGLPYFHQITYSASAPATVTYTAEGLPPGLTIHETTGHITGTPSQAGLFHFTVEVEHQFGVSLGQYSLRVVDLGIPFLQTPSAVAVPLLTAFEYIVPVSPAAEWFSAENLPPGLELNPITGVIAGSATTPGIYEVLLEAGNPHGKTEAKVNFMVETIPPKITRLPQHASIGSVIEVEGEGFATTSAVYISSQVTRMVPAEFEVVSDQILYVTIPEIQLFPPFLTFIKLTVVAESGATVTLFQDGLFYEVTSSMPISSGRTYLVRDGGILTDLTQGTSDFYLETGGSLHASMIRFSALYLEDGAVANITDPSFNTVIHTPNAVMSIADGFEMTFIEVPVLQPSMVPNYVNLAQVPSITSPRTTSGFFRMPFVYSVAVDISATAFEAEDLPDGLTLDPETGIISGRAQQQGSFSVRLKAINENGFGEATLALTIVDPYDFWREETFAALPGGAAHPLAASTADANQDGFENLLQFALGRDPLGSNDPSTLPVLGVQVGGAAPVSGGEVLAGIAGDPPSALTYSFRRRTGDGLGDTESGYTIGRVTYFVMVSHDLDSWHTGPDWLTQSGDPVENGDGTETVTVMLNATPIDPVFVKLKVVEE